jgi:hypothetical protein
MPCLCLEHREGAHRCRLRSARGQSLVEFALILPILLIFLVMTIDAGRLYFGWIALTNAARVGASYAADNPHWTPARQARYEALIAADAAARNCDMPTPPPPTFTRGGVAITDPELGDYAEVELTCAFDPVTPMAAQLMGGGPIVVTATSIFPVRNGCASCPPPPPAPEPQAPAQCREVPAMVGLSLAGARLAWQSAGFSLSDFSATSGSESATVNAAYVTEDDPTSNCSAQTPGDWAIFSSSVFVTLEPADSTDPSCVTAPNLKGMIVGDARVAWTAEFTGTFDPPDQDAQVVTDQSTSPTASTPGVSCIPPDSNITVTTGPAWAEAPASPCRVPNFSDKKKSEAPGLWTPAGFSGAISFVGQGQNDWKIQRQSLVGGDWIDCASDITLYRDP